MANADNPEYTYDMGIRVISGSDVTGGASSARYSIANENCKSLRIYSDADIRVQPGNSSVSVTTTTGMIIPAGMADLIRLKSTDTDLAYIGSGANINIVECE